MQFIRIPPGRFVMGDDANAEVRENSLIVGKSYPILSRNAEHLHSVAITRVYYLGIYEVTVGEFSQFVRTTNYEPEKMVGGKSGWNSKLARFRSGEFDWNNPGFPQTDEYPVANITWNDAQMFCQWLSQADEVKYRLPTEAEWEYACRAGSKLYPPENMEMSNDGFENFADQSFYSLTKSKKKYADDGWPFASPVGSFPPNEFGLFDMYGNVNEWCSDWYHQFYYKISPTANPLGPGNGTFRVFRGGSWREPWQWGRPGWRQASNPSMCQMNIGFRVVREVE
jgi:formylglycine-generating enzyme required for sulfatase activity